MVQIQKSEKKAVFRYLLQEGVIVVHKDFSDEPHKGIEDKGIKIPNIHIRKLMRSLKDRGFTELVFSWQHFYYFLTNDGKKYLSEYLNLTEEVVPLTWKYNHLDSGRTKSVSMNILLMITGAKLEERGSPVLLVLNVEQEGVPPAVRGVSAKMRVKLSQLKPLLPPNDCPYILMGQLAISCQSETVTEYHSLYISPHNWNSHYAHYSTVQSSISCTTPNSPKE